jgi:tetratricopeptide (TPR) repeat protein
MHDLGTNEARLGKYDDALAPLRQARAMFVAAYGERSVNVGVADQSIGHPRGQQRQLDDARRWYERGTATLSTVLPADSAMLADAEQALAVLLDKQDDCKESISHHRRAIAILDRNGRGGADLANEQVNLGACLVDVGQLGEARAMIERGIAGLDAAGIDEIDHCQPWVVLAELEWKAGHRGKAIEWMRKVIATSARSERPDIVQIRAYAEKTLAEWTR